MSGYFSHSWIGVGELRDVVVFNCVAQASVDWHYTMHTGSVSAVQRLLLGLLLFAKNLYIVQAGKIVSSPSAQAPDDAHASSSNDEDPVTSSNENVPHEDDGQSAAEPALVYSRTTTIHIDPETGEARNASTGETMEMSIRSLRPLPSTPPPVLIAEFQHLATESNLKVCDLQRCFLRNYWRPETTTPLTLLTMTALRCCFYVS